MCVYNIQVKAHKIRIHIVRMRCLFKKLFSFISIFFSFFFSCSVTNIHPHCEYAASIHYKFSEFSIPLSLESDCCLAYTEKASAFRYTNCV